MVARLPPSDTGSTNYERVMGHAPHILGPWSELEEVFFQRSLLPGPLLEQVRRTLADGHGCEYCKAKGGPPSASQSEMRTSIAVAFAQAYVADHRDISEAHIDILRESFSDAEVVELVAFVSFMWVGGTFGKVLGIKPPSVDASSSSEV